ncbi:transglutaminaseTgpA domain-containing protein [Paramicrobacterium fandaimingii]|uniref:transglutaminase family protein n=1 Tax=Paramicrobacterium fandaimingii TaxID=2708079 RepID=UPI001422E14B|nr:transglutaminase domain-containing protein [Microbacterium fandaimingii]
MSERRAARKSKRQEGPAWRRALSGVFSRTPRATRTASPSMPGTVSAQTWIDIAVVAGLILVGALGWMPVFDGRAHLLATVGGLAVGLGVAWCSHRLRLNAVTTLLMLFIAYFLFGSAFALSGDALWFVLPTLDTVRDLAVGAVFGWTDVVTLAAPVGAPPHLVVLPYVLSCVLGALSGILLMRWLPTRYRTLWRCAALLLLPLVAFVLPVVLGTREPYFPAVRGLIFAVVALIWLGWRRPEGKNISLSEKAGLRRARVLGTAAVALASVIIGGLAASILLPPAESRLVVRDEVQPPFDPEQFASPLSGYRIYTKTLNETDLLSVTGLIPGDRIRLAVMDTYDGHLWNVAGPELSTDGSGLYELSGSTLPTAPLADIVDQRTIDVDVVGYAGPWLPTMGVPEVIDLAGLDRERSSGFRFNAATGTAVLIDGVTTHVEYSMRSGIQAVPGDESLIDTPVASVGMPPVEKVPDIVVATAKEYAGAAESPIEQLRAIESALVTNGYLSHGRETDAASSRAGHGADRMEELFTRTQLIGDEEQYASAMALMARSFGYPARVVMGFAPKTIIEGSPTTVTGDDVTAWVEVPFEGVGWIPFFPTPDETEIPQEQNPKPQSEPQPQVRQPPRSEKRPDDLLTDSEIDDKKDKEDENAFALPGWAIAIIATVGGLLLLYLVPFVIIALIKRRRVKRRRRAGQPHARASGAWDEFLDRHSELGYEVPVRTRAGVIDALSVQRGTDAAATATLDRMAFDADAAVFADGEAADETIDRLWTQTDEQARLSARAVSWWRRQVSRFRVSRARRAPKRPTVSRRKDER